MVTKQEAGVLVARPANIPEAAPRTLGLRLRNHSSPIQPRAPAAAEKCVAANAPTATSPAPRALPALKPNQPTHNNPVPIRLRTTLCGIIGSCGKPERFPSTIAQTKAETPELI